MRTRVGHPHRGAQGIGSAIYVGTLDALLDRLADDCRAELGRVEVMRMGESKAGAM